MDGMKTYQGSCHCGAVTYEVDTDLSTVIECNCSICHKHGLVLAFVPAEQFRLTSGEDKLKEYRFHTMKIGHQLCTECGVEPFGKGVNKEGVETRAINVRCLSGLELQDLTITPVNGRDR